MNAVLVIAQKEMMQIIRSKNLMISALLFIVVFGMISTPAFITGGGSNPANVVDQLGFYLVLTLGIFTGYIFTGQAFFREKQDRVIETLLCTPLSLRRIWFGKVLGVTITAYLLTLLAACLIIGGASYASDSILLPGVFVVIHILFIVPLFIAVAVGLIGFLQLLLGMRENQILNFALIFVIIMLVTLTGELLGATFTVTGQFLGALFLIALALLGLTAFLTRFLDKERIITTIPE
jgi:ABC-2 type transport system permease protein